MDVCDATLTFLTCSVGILLRLVLPALILLALGWLLRKWYERVNRDGGAVRGIGIPADTLRKASSGRLREMIVEEASLLLKSDPMESTAHANNIERLAREIAFRRRPTRRI
ncbi:MAG: hypothetical protein WD940_01980 [Patescibacteria group bacterium]